jgi:hypothetical protein
MKKTLKQVASSAICIGLIFSAFSGAAAEPKAVQTSKPLAGGKLSWVAVAPLSGQSLTATADGGLFDSGQTPFAFREPVQCKSQPAPGKKLDWFATTFRGSKRSLSIQCGSASTHGYLHIAEGKSGHQRGWRKRVTMANPFANSDAWGELMWWSAIQSWVHPDVSLSQGNGKVCRSALIRMSGLGAPGSQNRTYVFRPTFIWSVTNDRLITAIPSTTFTC